ncbi:MAG: putative alpha/beta superfamily hydrolase [Polaribacter sp.]|jgi:predicted alpha/beta superfamily hydrolase
MIIITIPNTNRAGDLTPTRVDIDFFTGDSIQYANGGGNKFLDFMEEELIPHIEKPTLHLCIELLLVIYLGD